MAAKKRKPKVKLSRQAMEVFRRLGALGGKTRAKRMTAEERSAAARRAIQARWGSKGKERAT